MQKSKLLVAVLGTLIAMPALADSPFSANVSLTTDYLFRGISQTGHKPAIQGGFDYAGPNGFYAGVWASSISWISDGGLAANAGTEIDTYFGISNSFATDFTYDVGFLRYNYPANYVVAPTMPWAKADTNELYGSIGYKWLTLKYSYGTGDTFGVASSSSSYIDLSGSFPLSNGYSIGAHYGHQKYKGTANDMLVAGGADPSYSDYNISASKDFGSGYSGTLMYSKTNASTAPGAYYKILNKDLGKGTLVLSISKSF